MIANIILQCIYAGLASTGFSIIFNVRGKTIIFATLAGAFGCLVFELTGLFFPSELTQYFAAAFGISLFSEIIARLHKVPVTVCLIPGLIPFVPGGGIFYTMEYFVNGDTNEFLTAFISTVSIAGALAFGNLVTSSLIRLIYFNKQKRTI